jgi:hypothetical protein
MSPRRREERIAFVAALVAYELIAVGVAVALVTHGADPALGAIAFVVMTGLLQLAGRGRRPPR